MFKTPAIKSVLGVWDITVCLPGLSLCGPRMGSHQLPHGEVSHASVRHIALSRGPVFQSHPWALVEFDFSEPTHTLVKQKLKN